MSRRPVTLELLNAACRAAASHGWSRDDLRRRLVAANARWDRTALVDVPEQQRARLLSDLSHHPTWVDGSTSFCANLPKFNVTYAELADACELLGWARPSQVDHEQRARLTGMLIDGDERIAAALEEVRERADQKRNARAAARAGNNAREEG